MSEMGASIRRMASGPGDRASAAPATGARFLTLKRVAMAAATALVAINIWTGAPLLALWVGSQVVGKTVLSMRAVLVVVVVLAVLVYGLTAVLVWLNNRYDELIGRPRVERSPPWMRSMRAEAEQNVTMIVYVAIIALLLWFIFFAGPPFLRG
jgi:hypothetical protein